MVEAKLIVQVPDQPAREFPLTDRPLIVGRDPTCDICIESRFISRRHARIEPQGAAFTLVELGSPNPIFVNGEQLRGSRVLLPGDRIRIADVTMAYYEPLSDPEETQVFVARPEIAASKKEVEPQLSGTERERVRELFGLRGTLTIMFTDVEGSTDLTTRLGDLRAQEFLRVHNALLREEFLAHHGFEVKGQGDGFMVVFTSAREALRCAVAIQRRLAGYNTDHADLPIRVRIGLNVGEVISEEDDFFGTAVILAARIASRAEGGEILISELLQQIIAPTGEFQTTLQGSMHLKGFQRPQRVYAVRWDGDQDGSHESPVQRPNRRGAKAPRERG